jgi:hypothetical protein
MTLNQQGSSILSKCIHERIDTIGFDIQHVERLGGQSVECGVAL